VARGDAARGDVGPTGAVPTAVDREAHRAGREAASQAAPHQVAVGPGLAARVRLLAERPVGKPAVDQPAVDQPAVDQQEAAGRAEARVEMPAYRFRAAMARVGICPAVAGCGPERAPRTG
jgi:hypothetical protein